MDLLALPLATQLSIDGWPYRIVGHAADAPDLQLPSTYITNVVHYYVLAPEHIPGQKAPSRAIMEIWPATSGYGPGQEILIWKHIGAVIDEDREEQARQHLQPERKKPRSSSRKKSRRRRRPQRTLVVQEQPQASAVQVGDVLWQPPDEIPLPTEYMYVQGKIDELLFPYEQWLDTVEFSDESLWLLGAPGEYSAWQQTTYPIADLQLSLEA